MKQNMEQMRRDPITKRIELPEQYQQLQVRQATAAPKRETGNRPDQGNHLRQPSQGNLQTELRGGEVSRRMTMGIPHRSYCTQKDNEEE